MTAHDPLADLEVDGRPEMVPPMPMPIIVSIDEVKDADHKVMALLQISHPSGLSVFFMDRKLARQVGAELQRIGSGGLLTP